MQTDILQLRTLTLQAHTTRLKELTVEALRGPQGPKGDRGDTGARGAQGERGEQGIQGERGLQGLQGIQGKQGLKGQKGDKGDLGPMPKHQTRGDAIRFETDEGQWGKWINLNPGTQAAVGGGIGKDTVLRLIEEYIEGSMYDKLIDTVGDIKYIGEAAPGTASSEAKWRIKRVDLSDVGGDIEIVWANNSNAFDKVWDSRASYEYAVPA